MHYLLPDLGSQRRDIKSGANQETGPVATNEPTLAVWDEDRRFCRVRQSGCLDVRNNSNDRSPSGIPFESNPLANGFFGGELGTRESLANEGD